jgi:hypothetical protein
LHGKESPLRTITIPDAVAAMRQLEFTTTGRLRGVPATWTRYESVERILADTPQPWRDRLTTDLTSRQNGILTSESAEYLVFSDNVLIAVLTIAARVELPHVPTGTFPHRHQQTVATALADLPRTTLVDMADRRARMDGRDQQTRYEYQPPSETAIRVAPADDLTVTDWVTVDPDLAETRAHVRAAGLNPAAVVILSAPGYGGYGKHRHRLDLPTLSAIAGLADSHGLTVQVVGDWLHAEAATHVDPALDVIVAAFGQAYVGCFADTGDYVTHRMAELGWTKALADAGIPDVYLDRARITHTWLDRDIHAIARPAGIAVFTRHRRPA